MSFPGSLRGGGFGGGFGNLDPFGGSRGGLGRYSLGSSIMELERYEQYLRELGWRNGRVSDEDYLAGLRRQVDMAPEGTSDRAQAENELAMAIYQIARNKLVRAINEASTEEDRLTNLKTLQGHETARLGTMSREDSEAYREQISRVGDIAAQIRSVRYSQLIEKVNDGKADTNDLIKFVRQQLIAARGGPDLDDWTRTLGELLDRRDDEFLSDKFQDYQQGRLPGEKLLRLLQQRLDRLSDQDSPPARELRNQIEDLTKTLREEGLAKADSQAFNEWQAGKLSDERFLGHLAKSIEDAPAGSRERMDAKYRLREYTFSLAEDKLRFQVEKGQRPVGDLIRFYRSYQAGMDRGSQKWRTIQLAIDALGGFRGGGGGGGGGRGRGGGRAGSGGGVGGGGISLPGKVFTSTYPGFAALLADPDTPRNVGRLFDFNPSDLSNMGWLDKNRRSLGEAAQAGDATWTFWDKNGTPTELPFDVSMYAELARQDMEYQRVLIGRATTQSKRNTAIGYYITKAGRYRDIVGDISIDEYEEVMKVHEERKQRALAVGDFADYVNAVFDQQQVIKLTLGLPASVVNDPTATFDIHGDNQNLFLTQDMRDDIAEDLARLRPMVDDPGSDEVANPEGDEILALLTTMTPDKTFALRLIGGERTVRRTGTRIPGLFEEAVLDDAWAFMSQVNGRAVLVSWLSKPELFQPMPVVMPDGTERTQPRYKSEYARVSVKYEGDRHTFWQQINNEGFSASVLTRDTAALNQDPRAEGLLTTAQGFRPALKTIVTWERFMGTSQPVRWVSLDGQTWLRLDPRSGARAPELVLTEGSNATIQNGELFVNGAAYNPALHGDIGRFLHFYRDEIDGVGQGLSGWGDGARGAVFLIREVGPDGVLDTWFEDRDSEQERLYQQRAAGRTPLPAAVRPGPRVRLDRWDEYEGAQARDLMDEDELSAAEWDRRLAEAAGRIMAGPPTPGMGGFAGGRVLGISQGVPRMQLDRDDQWAAHQARRPFVRTTLPPVKAMPIIQRRVTRTLAGVAGAQERSRMLAETAARNRRNAETARRQRLAAERAQQARDQAAQAKRNAEAERRKRLAPERLPAPKPTPTPKLPNPERIGGR